MLFINVKYTSFDGQIAWVEIRYVETVLIFKKKAYSMQFNGSGAIERGE